MQLSRDAFLSPINDVLVPPNYFFSNGASPHGDGRESSESKPATHNDDFRDGPKTS